MNGDTLDDVLSRLRRVEHKFDTHPTIFDKDYGQSKALMNLESKMSSLQSRVDEHHKALFGADGNAPVSHQLVESVTGITGLSESIKEKNRALKNTWRVLLIIGIAMTCFFVYSTTRDYLMEPTLTKVRMKVQSSYEFPPIVLCTDDWFDVAKATTELNMSADALKYSLGYWGYFDDYSRILRNLTESKLEFFQTFDRYQFRSLSDYFKFIATDVRAETSEQAFFDAPHPAYLSTDGLVRMEKVNMIMTGVCYTFTLQPIDARLGVMNDPRSIFLKYADLSGKLGTGMRNWVIFLRPDAGGLYKWPLAVAPYETNYVTIRSTTIVSMSKSDAPCHTKSVGDKYTSANCMAECQSRLLQKSMNCKAFWISPDHDSNLSLSDFCNTFDFMESKNRSLEEAVEQRQSFLANQVKGECFHECPRSCEKTRFDATFDGTSLEWDYHLKQRLEESRNTSFTTTVIYFLHDAMYQGGISVMEEVSSYSFTELVDNVGGTLGLFIGGTLMTIAQIVLFFVGRLCAGKKKEG